jgi:DNA-directed RNA polymerase subunit M/transcription elongation factor TFIIS
MTKLKPEKNLYRCPKCGSTEFTADVITQYSIEIYKDGDMIPVDRIEKPQQDNIDEGSVMCAKCDKDIDVRTILKLLDNHIFGKDEDKK